MPTPYFCAETGKWMAMGGGVCGIGTTAAEALAAWLADYKRVNPQAPVALSQRRE
jgi:hypothetical protein